MEGLPGVYLGNQLHESFRTDLRLQFDKYVQTKVDAVARCCMRSTVWECSSPVTLTLGVSQVTFNGGARWQDLNQPESYQYPECNRCASARDLRNCQLHLHGPSSWHDGQGAFCRTACQSTALHVLLGVSGVPCGAYGMQLAMTAASRCVPCRWEAQLLHT